MQPRVYLCGPMQHAADHGKGWRQRLKANYDNAEWLDPVEKYDASASYDELEREWTDERIVSEDKKMIDDADAILVHWELVPTAGTPMEVLYATESHKPVVVQTTVRDEELSPWITAHADAIVETFDEAVDEVVKRGERSAAIIYDGLGI